MAYEFVDETPPASPAGGGRFEFVDDIPPAAPKKSLLRRGAEAYLEAGRDMGAGLVRGAGSIGATLLAPVDMAADALDGKGLSLESNRARRAAMDGGLRELGADTDSFAYGAGKLGGEIAGTAAAGPLLASGGKALPIIGPRIAPAVNAAANAARSVPLIGRAVDPLARSIGSAGMSTGLAPQGVWNMGRAADVATRVAGGAVAGGASAGLVNPDDALAGAVIGSALPPALQVAGKVSTMAGNAVRSIARPTIAKDAETIMKAGGYGATDAPALRSALGQQGPQIVQAPRTTAQVLQNPGISDLQRAVDNAGGKSVNAVLAQQDAARLAALDAVAPTAPTLQTAADNFGSVAQPQILAGDKAARARTSAAFGAVDPFGDSKLLLPIEAMEAEKAKFLGRATFGAGGNAQAAIDTAKTVGTDSLEALAPAVNAPARQQNTLLQAVRRAGGISGQSPSGMQLRGELNDLRQAQGLRGVVNTRGQSVDKLAQEMHGRGLIPDDDPATLLNYLRDPDLANSSAHGGDLERFQRAAMEAVQNGEAPGAATIAKPVSFDEVQDLRSSIGEAARKADLAGNAREAAALKGMQRQIDDQVSKVAGGGGKAGESFPPDMVAQWRAARDLKKQQVDTFRTGPQAGLFRQGGDQLPAVNGGELAGKFFNGNRSQTADIAGFGRVATPETQSLLQQFATTEARAGADRLGNLTNSKFDNWRRSRSGAIGGLFDRGQQAQLGGIGRSLDEADRALALSMPKGGGSNTVKNALSIGLLDHPAVGYVSGKLPSVAGPILRALANSARGDKVGRLDRLLSDPEALERAIATYQKASGGRPLGLGRAAPAVNLGVRSAPVLLTGQ